MLKYYLSFNSGGHPTGLNMNLLNEEMQTKHEFHTESRMCGKVFLINSPKKKADSSSEPAFIFHSQLFIFSEAQEFL